MSRHSRQHLLATALLILLTALSCGRIPERVGDWRVEVGPPGNEYCLTSEHPEENPPPPEKLLRIVRELAPSHTEVSSWRLRHDDTYWIRTEAEPDRYEYYIAPDGTLSDITYYNTSEHTREKAYALLIRDTRKSISLEDVPSKTLETLAKIIPGTEPSEAWIASTVAGTRYLVAIGEMIFYARPDGQIQSGRAISEGALEENYPKNVDRDIIIDEIMSETAELLGDYRERLSFDHQIRRLKSRQTDQDARFRFVVMGDSRSNYDLWVNMLKHMALLDPVPEFIINTGDLVPRGLVKYFADYVIPPLMECDIPFFVAIGNHDYGFEKKAREYRCLFGDNALNYFFDYRGYRFIFVDNVTTVRPFEETAGWLDEVLSGTPAGFKTMVSFHVPFGNIEKWAYHAMKAEQAKPFTDLMSRYGVEHVFCGHIHAYSTATFQGVDYTISGGAGAGLHDRFGPLGSVHHYIICDVEADGTLSQQVVRFYKD